MTRLPDPAGFPDRACAGVDQDIFFPYGLAAGAIRTAKGFCTACPRLRQCAAWALPMAASGALSGCVVAGVYLPLDPKSRKAEAARDELAAIATETKEPSWTAA
ncbi:WhiB family transcriptional regulator [Nocardia sp. NPDC127579]|uniref:WhiB family transcriptional regulator n=1 Tax=Nocardia sp. NPDC127579 TaxID=3345402 RepID=UPI00363DEF0C